MEGNSGRNPFNFACCRLKYHNYYVCVNCFGLFHGSCLHRDRKNFTKIGQHTIICCNTLDTRDDKTEELKILKNTLLQLKTENDALKFCKTTLEKRLVDTQNDALEMEENLLFENQKQQSVIQQSKKAIESLKEELLQRQNLIDNYHNPSRRTVETQTRFIKVTNLDKAVQTQTLQPETELSSGNKVTFLSRTEILNKNHTPTTIKKPKVLFTLMIMEGV